RSESFRGSGRGVAETTLRPAGTNQRDEFGHLLVTVNGKADLPTLGERSARREVENLQKRKNMRQFRFRFDDKPDFAAFFVARAAFFFAPPDIWTAHVPVAV